MPFGLVLDKEPQRASPEAPPSALRSMPCLVSYLGNDGLYKTAKHASGCTYQSITHHINGTSEYASCTPDSGHHRSSGQGPEDGRYCSAFVEETVRTLGRREGRRNTVDFIFVLLLGLGSSGHRSCSTSTGLAGRWARGSIALRTCGPKPCSGLPGRLRISGVHDR
jgi:hypothetical protein